MKTEIRNFLTTHRADPTSGDFTDDESLTQKGVLDSVAMVDLITHLESSYGISVADSEMMPENFDSLNAICSLVERKLPGQG